MKGPGDYQKAITILKSLWDRSAGQEKPDTSILLDLAAAYSNGEDWEGVIKTASEYIQRSPSSPGGPGYCWRSFGNYRLGQCQKTLEDGPKCTNPDGTPRQLKYVDYCRQELDKQKAAAERVAVASKEEIKTKCQQLKTNADWARTNPDAEMTDLVSVIGDFEAGKSRCREYLGALETVDLCQATIQTASNPLNLSLKTDAEMNDLYNATRKYANLCNKHLNDSQKAAVGKALKTLGDRISPPQ
jgi:hypothetical protein